MVEIISVEAKFAANQAVLQAQNVERIRQRDKLSAQAFQATTDKILAANPSGSQSAGRVVSGKEGADAVTKALGNSIEAFTKLSELLSQIADSAKSGSRLGQEQTSALNDKIKAVAVELDKLAAGAKVGGTNLLEKTPGGVTVVSASGDKVNIATEAVNGNALGLKGINITDEASLRQATAAIAKAAGKVQLTVFRLQTADGVTGTPAPVNAGIAAYDKIRSNADAAAASRVASDLVENASPSSTIKLFA